MRTLRKTIKIKKNSGLRVDNEGPRFKISRKGEPTEHTECGQMCGKKITIILI